MLRVLGELFGHRYMMDKIIPGGVDCDISTHGGEKLRNGLTHTEQVSAKLREIYDEHSGAQDRFLSTDKVTPELAYSLA